MDALVHLAWRSYPAALMLLGIALTVRAIRTCQVAWRRPLSGSMQPLTWMRGFRLTIIGLALVGVGAAWQWHLGWLLAVSLAIAFEETLECSIAIAALRRAEQRDSEASTQSSAPRAGPLHAARPVTGLSGAGLNRR